MQAAQQREWMERLLEGFGSSRATTPGGLDPGLPFQGFLGRPERAKYVFIGTNPGAQKADWHGKLSLDDQLLSRKNYFCSLDALREWDQVWKWYLPPLGISNIDRSGGLAHLNELAVVTNIVHLPTRTEVALKQCADYRHAVERSWPLTQELLLATPATRWVVQGNFAWKYVRNWLGVQDFAGKPFIISVGTPGPNPRQILIMRTQHLTAMQSTLPHRLARAKANHALSDWNLATSGATSKVVS